MPGAVVTTTTRSGQSGPLQAPSGQFFAVGLTERGSVSEPILLRGMADVATYLGDRPSFGALYDQLQTFFNEGGTQAYVARVVGPAASVGNLSLNDRNGTPVATLRVDAANPGVWSSRVTIEVQNGSITDTFRIIVRLDGDVVEDVTNLSSPLEAVAKFAKSPYIRVVNLGSATTAPNNNPAVLAATALSSGADDRASVTATHHVDALARFNVDLGDGAVAIPGQTGSTTWDGIIAHCETHNRIGLLAGIQNETVSNLKTQATGLDSEFAGLFAPWIVVSDGGYGTRTISPEGFVAARRNRAHEQLGPWRAPAGAMGKAETVIDLAQTFDTDTGQELDDAKVSVIRKIQGSIRLYGWRSLSNDTDNYTFLKDRDVLNRLVTVAGQRIEQYVFEPVDGRGQLLSALKAELIGLCVPFVDAGAFYPLVDPITGQQVDPGYKVETGSEVNTQQSLANNEVRARLSVRISPTASLINLNIVKVGILAGL